MIKILFVITTLGGGGAERIVTYLANGFSRNKNCKVSLLLMKEEGNTYLSHLSKEIEIVNLNLKGRLRFNCISIVNAIIRQKPNICFIGLDGLNILLAPFIPIMKKKGIRMIVRETNVLSRMWTPSVLNRTVYKLFYNKYDNVICQSKDMADDLINVWKIKPEKITIINNPVNVSSIQKLSLIPIEEIKVPNLPFFVSVGRLTYQKGFDKLIDNIYILNKKNKFPFCLLILGEGELKNTLKSKIDKYGLGDKVKLLGRIENPYRIMAKAKGFILSSLFEGFPNVLLEANSLGLPIFANKCPGGINEIVIEEINGITANFENEMEFETCFEKFLNVKFDPVKIKDLTYNRYDTSFVFPKFEKLFLI